MTPKRECHKCPYNGKGSDYCWKECIGPADVSDKGITKVRTGTLESPDEFIDMARLDAPETAAEISAEESVWLPIDELEDANFGRNDARDPDADDGQTENRRFRKPPDEDDSSHGVTSSLAYSVERALVVILANVFGSDFVDDIDLCIVRHAFRGEDLATIGKNLPIPMSKQAVEKRTNELRAKNPVLWKVVDEMKRKGVGGARRTMEQSEFDLPLWESAGESERRTEDARERMA